MPSSAHNAVQNKWVSPTVESKQTLAPSSSAQQYPMSTSFAGRRIVGNSSNSGLSHHNSSFNYQNKHEHRDYRGTPNMPASQSLNYDEQHGRSHGPAPQSQGGRDIPGARGRSTEPVDSAQLAYKYGCGLNQSASQTMVGGQAGQ